MREYPFPALTDDIDVLQQVLSIVTFLVTRAALYNFLRHRVYLLTGRSKSVSVLLFALL